MDITLSLNLISYSKDSQNLQRCLESVKGSRLFDRTFITDTSSEPSEQIRKICDTYGAIYSYKKFEDDFSEVRNFNFDQSDCLFIQWLDSDDTITPETLKALEELKPRLHEFDCWLLAYNYAFDQNGKAVLTLPRERIVRNCPEIRWIEPVHECLTIQQSKLIRLNLSIDHHRTGVESPDRNLKIFRKQLEKGPLSSRGKFYFAKELYDSGSRKEAVEIFLDYLNEAPGVDFVDNIAIACHKLAQHYSLENDFKQAKVYALKSIQYSNRYAEPFYLLGEIYHSENKIETAKEYFRECLSKKCDAGMSQLPVYYGYLPQRALAIIARNEGDLGMAKRFAALALTYQSDPELEKIAGGFSIEPRPVWLFPGQCDETNGSQRIRRINLHKQIPGSRIIEHYLSKPYHQLLADVKDSNIVIFQNFCEADYWLIKLLQQMGKKVIFDDCEMISGYPWQHETMLAADAVTCCSTKLAEHRVKEGNQRVAVVVDPYELSPLKSDYTQFGEKPVCLFIGMGGNSFLAKSWLGSVIEAAGYQLRVCTEWDDADVKWSLENWRQVMLEADVVLCPQRYDVQPGKSNVKATQAMSMGIPVICSPLQAYLEVVQHGVNGYIADCLGDWKNALMDLRDQGTRERIGKAAVESVKAYSIEETTNRWMALAKSLLLTEDKVQSAVPQRTQTQAQPEERIDIIIPNYNNWDYLRMTLDSILINTNSKFRIIISDAGSSEKTWDNLRGLKGFVILGEPGHRLNFSEAVNAGIRASNSKYFVLLNSDVIVSKNWLNAMKDKMDKTHRLSSCGVLSNCDRGWRFTNEYNMRVNDSLELVPGMKLEHVKPHLDDLYRFMEGSNIEHKDQYIEQDWVAGYCTMYARSAVDEVGLLDTQYVNGCEDLDLEKRLRAFGYKAGQALDSFVFHFGGVSRGAYQEENRVTYAAEDGANHVYYQKKWSKKRIAIYTGPAWEPWTIEDVEKGMAGSESWAAYIARVFARLGYDTTIYGHLKDPDVDVVIDGVRYVDSRKMEEDLQYLYVDLFISSRTVDTCNLKIHALKHYVMIHDVFLHPDPNHDMQTWRIQRYYYLSKWHKEFLMHHHKSIPEDKLFKTSNGVAPYYWVKPEEGSIVKTNSSVYSSSPDRGLYQLLKMMPVIRTVVQDFTLHVCYGFYNWEEAAKARNDRASMILIDKIKALMEQPGVVYHGRVNKKRLYDLQMQASVWLYPSWFDESFCITALENKLCGNAIVTTAKGGLLDTASGGILLNSAGLTRDGDYPEEYVREFQHKAVKVLTDKEYREEIVRASSCDLDQYRWINVAKDFLDGGI